MSTASTVSSTALADNATDVVASANADLFRVAPIAAAGNADPTLASIIRKVRSK
jgi:hypothetical protein